MPINSESKEIQKEYLKIAASYSIPLFWGVKNGTTWNVEYAGTAFVLDTGTQTFVVTAAHVYETYLARKKLGLRCDSQLSNISFELEERLISCLGHKIMDIATFKITNDEISRLNKNVLHGSNDTWPPRRPVENQAVVIAGFPGLERQQVAESEYSFALHCFNTPVSSISDRHFGCSFERQYWVDIYDNGLPAENYDLGGISGAPALALEKSASGIVSWRLAGVVYEAKASEVLGEILFVHHSESISATGIITPSTT